MAVSTRRVPLLAVEMEITVEYSVSRQPTIVSTNDIIRLNKCHKVSPIVLTVSRDNDEILICPVSVTACGCYSAEHDEAVIDGEVIARKRPADRSSDHASLTSVD